MDFKLLLIIVVLDLGQEVIPFKLQTSNKLENGDNLLGAISNRLELKTKCSSCKRQNKCKPPDVCPPCEDICEKYQQSGLKKPLETVGISQRTSENPSGENEDRYYTVGAFKDGPVQRLLQKLLNLNVRGPTDHMIVMVKPKSKTFRPISHPVVIDTAHVFTTNEGNAKKLELELHKVKNVDKPTEELVEKLDEKFENVVEDKKKANMDPHLMPDEIDDIIEKTLQEEQKPSNQLVASRLTENKDIIESTTNNFNIPTTYLDEIPSQLTTTIRNLEDSKLQTSLNNQLTPTEELLQSNEKSSNKEVLGEKQFLENPKFEPNSDKILTNSDLSFIQTNGNEENLPIKEEINQDFSNKEILEKKFERNQFLENSKFDSNLDKISINQNMDLIQPNENENEENPLGEINQENQNVPNKITTSSKRVLEDNQESNVENVQNVENIQSVEKTLESLLPENIPNDKPIKLIPSSNNLEESLEKNLEENLERNLEKNLEENLEKTANQAIKDASISAKETNEKIKDLVQQIFPDSLRKIDQSDDKTLKKIIENNPKDTLENSLAPGDEIKLINNQKFRTTLTPEEQSMINQENLQSPMKFNPQSDIYRKHPRLETVPINGNYQTVKNLPQNGPFISKYRNFESNDNQNEDKNEEKNQNKNQNVNQNENQNENENQNQDEIIKSTYDDGKIPFIDRNLINMDSLMKNSQKSYQENIKKDLEEAKNEDKLLKKGNEENEEVGCSKEEMQYLKVDPPNSYDDIYRSSGLHLPKLADILNPKMKSHPHPKPLDFPKTLDYSKLSDHSNPIDYSKSLNYQKIDFPKPLNYQKLDKLPKIHHSNSHLYRNSDEDSSSEEDSREIVEGRHQERNTLHHLRNLGRLIPREHLKRKRDTEVSDINQIKHKNMFFVGDGIKLPLTLKEFSDGSLHLSIDVKALCNCKHCNGKKHHNNHNTSEVVGEVQKEEIVDVPIKVYEDNKLPKNAIPIELDVDSSNREENLKENLDVNVENNNLNENNNNLNGNNNLEEKNLKETNNLNENYNLEKNNLKETNNLNENYNLEENNLNENYNLNENNSRLKRSPWNNKIEKIEETQISPEKFHFLKDIFSFMKNLVSDDIYIE